MPDPLTEELNKAVAGQRREVLPLDYATRRKDVPPFDWWGALRQIFFALGIAIAVGAAIDIWADLYDAWRRNGVLWMAFGVGLVALAIPWPGHFGRKR